MIKTSLLSIICLALSFTSPAQEFRKHVEKKDHRNQVTYAATITTDTVYINLKIESELALTKILRWGFNIYFDQKGEKKRKRLFSYPIKRETKNRWEDTEIEIQKLLNKLPDNALISIWERKELVPLKYTNSGVKLSITFLPFDMKYTLQLPTSKLFDQDVKSLEKLNIIFETEDFDMTKQVMEFGIPEGFAHFESLDPEIVIEKLSYKLKIDLRD